MAKDLAKHDGASRSAPGVRTNFVAVWGMLSRSQRALLGVGLTLMVVAGAVNSVIPLVLGWLVDGMLNKRITNLPSAGGLLGLLAIAYFFREALHVGRKIVVERTCTSVERDVAVALVSRLHHADIASLSEEQVGTLHGRMQRSLDGLARFLKLTFLDMLPVTATAIFALAVATIRHPLLGLVMAGAIPVGGWIIVRQIRSQRGVRLALLQTKNAMDGVIVEQLRSLDYVRVANTHEREIAKIREIATEVRSTEYRHHVAMAFFDCWKALNEGAFHIAVMSLAILLASRGSISVGDVLTFSMLFLSVINPLRELHRIVDEGHEASLRVEDLLRMLNEPADESFRTGQAQEPVIVSDRPALVVRNLSMTYAGSTLVQPLKGTSFAVPTGAVVGIAGASGCGKSSALRVILRLAHRFEGTVELGGVPLREVSREALARLVSYVGQKPFIFTGTVEENIAYGCDGTTHEAVVEAAKLAQVHDEILQMPGGYQRAITEGGQNLSGGQCQRLALARVFLKKAPLIVLDEATSALDNLNEQAVMRSIRETLPSSTIVLVAHRLTTLRATDSILVFENGKVVEQGTYDELINKRGAFANLALGLNGDTLAA